MLTVYGRATSLNVQVVMWTLAELDLPVDRIDIGFGFGGTDMPEYLAMNPNGLVPVLKDENVTLFESAAILRYLAARYARFPFWPEDPVARAPVDMWAEWSKTTLQPSCASRMSRFLSKPARALASIGWAVRAGKNTGRRKLGWRVVLDHSAHMSTGARATGSSGQKGNRA